MKTRALWHINPGRSEIVEKDIGVTPSSALVIRTLYSLVSPGTEKLVASGMVPAEIQQDMQVPFMEGDFSFPIKYGYSTVGKIISGDANLEGKLVHLLHPHQDLIVANKDDVFPVPGNIPATRAVLASNMETALNAVWDGNVGPGEKLLICGFGVIGALTALVAAQIPAVQVDIAETDILRQHLAHTLGFSIVGPDLAGEDYDIAINTSGSADGLQMCIDRTAGEGSIIEMSWYGNREVTLKLGGSFHARRKRIIASQVSAVALTKRNRIDHRRRREIVFRLLENPVFDKLPFDIVPFEQLPELFYASSGWELFRILPNGEIPLII